MQRSAVAVILIISLFWALPAIAGELNDGIAAYDRGDYKTAYLLIKPLADKGLPEAQFNLGLMYANGHGVPQDYGEAMKWYWKAAHQGVASAQHNLGVMYDNGHGVPQDDTEALKWYRRAADQGHEGSQSNLGVMYEDGKGVLQDYVEAAMWYRRAAEQGVAFAQANLGRFYALGQGVLQDYALAHKWFNLAASRYPASEIDARKKAIHNRDLVASKMTPAQIAEAQRLAREWKPKMER
jgi:hypothetical protein